MQATNGGRADFEYVAGENIGAIHTARPYNDSWIRRP